MISALSVALQPFGHATDSNSSNPPNVLFIAIDDLACTLGCYGDRLAKTPCMDRLAAEGTAFTRAYNQIPLCNPSRASVMTGLRPDQLKVYDLDRHFRDEVPNVVTLPQVFQHAGYRVARVGKIYHYNVPAAIGTDGFDDPQSWQQTINPIGRDKSDEPLIFNTQPHRKISAALSWLAADGDASEQTDGMVATAAIQWMKQHRDEPFFLAAGFFRPHTPFVAPKTFFDQYAIDDFRLPFAPTDDRDDIPTAAFAHNCPLPHYGLDEITLRRAMHAYYACVSFVDAQVGRLIDALDELQLRDQTIVVLWSDHGYHLGEHGGIWQKRTLFEASARSPMMIWSPKHHPPTRSPRPACDRIVEYVDLYPTIIDLAGLTLSDDLAGRSLTELLEDPRRDWQSSAVTQILRPADNRLPEPVMGCSIRTDRYRFSQWAGGAYGSELYDYQSDPGEFRN
ncbi:MAG: sulfatase, partial [Planctomycetota bacterium]